jgi:hypothetical protein
MANESVVIRDEFGLLVREQNGPKDPGRIGDSCFDTSCDVLANLYLGCNVSCAEKLKMFFTTTGTIRHPKSPWRENDQTSDQDLLLYVALKLAGNPLHLEMKKAVIARGYRTGNWDFVSPGYLAEILDSQILRSVCLLVQLIFFLFPFYWNDGKWLKGEWPIGNNYRRSDGYLAWVLIAVMAPKFIRKLIPKSVLYSKIKSYYAPDPNSAWVLRNYEQVIERYF